MWLRSEKRSSRNASNNNKSSKKLRKIVKNTPALKSLKQTTTNVTSSRRSGLCTDIAKSKTALSNNGVVKQSPSIKCNIKKRTGVKRLNKKSGNSLEKRNNRRQLNIVKEESNTGQNKKYGRLESMRTEIGKENCWQNQDQFVKDSKREQNQKVGGSYGSIDFIVENADNNDTHSSVIAINIQPKNW